MTTAAAGAQASTEAPKADATADAAAAAAAAKAGETKPGDEGKGKETPAAGEKPAATDEASKAAAAAAAAKAPAKYELKVPDGGDQYIGAEDLKFIEEVARANDWTQDEAQGEIASAVERATKREKQQGAALLAELKADEDYGGDKLEETQTLTKKAIDRIFPVGHRLREKFLAQMSREVIGNNLVYAAALAEVGRMLGEDSPAASRQRSAGGDAASKLYDHPTSKTATT